MEARVTLGLRGGQIPQPGKHLGLTAGAATSNIFRLMSAELPEVLDAWRMVAARRGFEGTLPLSSMSRLRDSLCDDVGEVRYEIGFDRDALQVPYVELRIQAALPLVCQRSLKPFLQPVQVEQRLALLPADTDLDAAEAGLPEGYEALPVPADGALRLAELVEDELILAVPVVAISPGSEALAQEWPATAEELQEASPFAALAALKKRE